MEFNAIGNVCKQTPSGSFFSCHRPDLCLAVLKSQQELQFFGVFDLQVLCGSVQAHGYKFEAGAYNEKKFISICVPYMLGPPITISSTQSKSALKVGRLKWRIQEVSDATSSILENIRDGDSVLLLRFLIPKAALCAWNIYDIAFFIPNSCDLLMLDSFCCVLLTKWNLSTNSIHKNLAVIIDNLEKKRSKNVTSVVMLTGGKSTGKSTSARYIANCLLNKGRVPIYFLDTDVGQSEKNPPGCVSLFRVETPMLEVPFSSQRKTFTDSFFVGDISPSGNVELYSRSVLMLYEKFVTEAIAGSVLIVNTPGWVEDDGKKLLDDLIAQIAPDCLFNILSREGPNYQGEGIKQLQETEGVVIINHVMNFTTLPIAPVPFTLTPAALRNLLILGYMAPLCPTASLGSLADATPYAVPFGHISVYLNPRLGSVPETHLLAALNCALVALCSVRWDKGEINGKRHILNDEMMPGMIEGECVVLRCLGFGLIRAIDLAERVFYVLTPVPEKVLNEVNVFAKGINIDLPTPFFTQRASREAPYVISGKSGRSDAMYSELALISCYKRTQPGRKHI